jgi:hypothetical protein
MTQLHRRYSFHFAPAEKVFSRNFHDRGEIQGFFLGDLLGELLDFTIPNEISELNL